MPKTVVNVKISILFILTVLSAGRLMFSEKSHADFATLYLIDLSVVPFNIIPPVSAPASVGLDVCPKTISLS